MRSRYHDFDDTVQSLPVQLTFDMRGDKTAQPACHPSMEWLAVNDSARNSCPAATEWHRVVRMVIAARMDHD